MKRFVLTQMIALFSLFLIPWTALSAARNGEPPPPANSAVLGKSITISQKPPALMSSVLNDNDTDGDGMDDTWEGTQSCAVAGHLAPLDDADGDYFYTLEEFFDGTSPCDIASHPVDYDNNYLLDSWEAIHSCLSGGPSETDSDGDGFSDFDEFTLHALGADPCDPDTPGDLDSDGVPDPWEAQWSCTVDGNLDPEVDSDQDGISNYDEYSNMADPCSSLFSAASTTTTTTTATTTTTGSPTGTTTTLPQDKTTATLSLPVSQGWNLLSSSIGFPAATIFNDKETLVSVWKWTDNGGQLAAKTWAVLLPGESPTGSYATSKGFAELTTIESGEGFWINAAQAGEVKITGTPASGDLILTTGWNLVGSKEEEQITPSMLGKVTSVWKWENSTWSVYLPDDDGGAAYANLKGFIPLTTISPGEGFWVNTP